MSIPKTTAKQARDIAYQTTQMIHDHKGGQISETWNENPAIWWSNLYSHASLASDYFESLVMTIITQRINAKSFQNPLSRFKKAENPLGFGSTEIYFNPQKGRYFAINPEELSTNKPTYPGLAYQSGAQQGEGANLNATFATNPVTTVADGAGETNQAVNSNRHLLMDKLPDIKQVFFRVNYGRQYQRTYTAVELQKVATTWESYGAFIDAVATDINASQQIDEYGAEKELFSVGIENGFLPEYPIGTISTKDDADNLLIAARDFYTRFSYPSEDYNAWNMSHPGDKIKTWSNADEISIILSSHANAVIDVKSLTSAFNIDRADFIGRVQVIDKLDDNGNIIAVLFDDRLIHFEEYLNQTGSFFNIAGGGKENIFKNYQACISLNPFANAVVFTSSTFTLVSEEPDDWDTATIGTYYIKNANGSYLTIDSTTATFAANTFYSKS